VWKESETLELKSSFAEWREIIVSLAAFSNKSGGTVIVGLSDEGEPTGLSVGGTTLEDIANKIRQHTDPILYPSINVKTHGPGEIVEIAIPGSDNKPVFAFDRAYIRVGRANQKMSNEAVRALIKRYALPAFDEQEMPVNATAVMWNRAVLKQFGITGKDPLPALKKQALLKNGHPLNAAYLCFCETPGLASNAMVKVARFKGRDMAVFIDMKDIRTALVPAVDETIDFIKRHIGMEVEITGKARRTERWEYPLDALREGVINAVVHRDYTDPGTVQIRIFDDRLEIWSPGLLPKELSVKNLPRESRSIPRNKTIARIFHAIRLIENWGSGFQRIAAACEGNGNPAPVFEEKAGAFVITIHPKVNGGVNGTLTGTSKGTLTGKSTGILTEGRRSVYELIMRKPGIQAKDIQAASSIPIDTLNKHLRYLIEKKFIERRGAKKTGGYFVIK